MSEHEHCEAQAHCRTCREFEAGRPFRAAFAPLIGASSIDFDCLHGKPWNHARTFVTRQERRERFGPLYRLECEARRHGSALLAGYLAQLFELWHKPPAHLPCRSRETYRQRVVAKGEWYVSTFGLGERENRQNVRTAA